MNIEKIEQRETELSIAAERLKAHFIGIDQIIDQLIQGIRVWYVMPELLTRPTIVNLWGMTGVGKTDLIRRLVNSLNFQDRYIEIELSNIDETSYESSIYTVLSESKMHDGKPSIILFDEIQKFYTLDNDGIPLQKTKFADFWELLSDGKLTKRIRGSLDRYIFDFAFAVKENEKKAANPNADYYTPSFSLDYYEAEQIYNLISSGLTIADLAKLTKKEALELLISEKERKKVYDPVDHKQTLIIISGNLDEAFVMANQISEADVDADIFHAFTKKINIVDIKNALAKKFRPEEVARFGNVHLIYSSLCKKDFIALIKKEVEKIISLAQENYHITLTVSDNILNLIYRNGVFPAQGVRPVFSSIVDILESRMPLFLLEAMKANAKQVDIDYNTNKSLLTYAFNGIRREIPFMGKIDKIRQSNTQDALANISVHESGHAVAYMLLFGLTPLQLTSKIASSYAGGFTFPHQIHSTKENTEKMIKVYLAGGLAEELIFGDNHASHGRAGDRVRVTELAVDYIRTMGFVEEFQAVYTLQGGASMTKTKTDEFIETFISTQATEVKKILSTQKALLLELSSKLEKLGVMSPKEMQKIAQNHNVQVEIKPEAFLYIHDYHNHI
jgi:hypothetical protein